MCKTNFNMTEVYSILNNKLSLSKSNEDIHLIAKSIHYLMADLEIDKYWTDSIENLGISLEKYVVMGVLAYLERNNYTAKDLWDNTDDILIFECIHNNVNFEEEKNICI